MFFGRVWLECETEDLIDLLILARDFDDHLTFERASKLMGGTMTMMRLVCAFEGLTVVCLPRYTLSLQEEFLS